MNAETTPNGTPVHARCSTDVEALRQVYCPDDSDEAICQQAAEEIEWLRAIVGRLPHTADGVPVVPGMDLFKRTKACHQCGRPVAIQRPQVDAVEARGIVRRHGHKAGWVETASDLYSTREAAENRR